MSKYFFITLFLINPIQNGKLSLIDRKGPFHYHYGIQNLDSQGKATYKEYPNPEVNDLIDNIGEFNFWSNGFITVRPGELVTFPNDALITSLTVANTAEWTYNVSTTFYDRETRSMISSISSLDQVFVCFRIYVSKGRIFAEISLRKPNKQTVSEKIIEIRKKGQSRMFLLNNNGGLESNWKCEEDEDFRITALNGTSGAFVWRSTRAYSTCYIKYFAGDVNITFEKCGINYFEATRIIL